MFRTGKLVAVLAALALLGATGVVAYQKLGAGASGTAVAALESALARADLVAMASVNVAGVLANRNPPPPDEPDLLAIADALGVGNIRDVDHLVFALYAEADGTPRIAAALLGRVTLADVRASLARREGFAIRDETAAGFVFTVRDSDSCELHGPYDVEARDGALWLTEAGVQPDPGEPERLGAFQEFRRGQLVALGLFQSAPDPALSHPLVRGQLASLRERFGDYDAVFVGASLQTLPAGLEVSLEARGGTRPGNTARVAAWKRAVAEARIAWAGVAPAAVELLENPIWRADEAGVGFAARVDRGWSDRAALIPGALLGGALRSDRGAKPMRERVDLSPSFFEVAVDPDALEPYDAEAPEAWPPDWTEGPFALRVSEWRLADGAVPEIELDALATYLPNYGDRDERAHLEVTAARSADGRNLLREESCGPERNRDVEPLSDEFAGEVFRARKSLRLEPGANFSDVEKIEGAFVFSLPTATEVHTLAPEPGVTLVAAGARLVLKQVLPGGFTYRLAGARDRVLHIRALNGEGKPLVRRLAARSGPGTFDPAESGTLEFSGTVAAVEVVVASDVVQRRVAFAIEDVRPGTSGERIVQTVPVAAIEPAGLLDSRAPESTQIGVVAVTAGPFAVVLEELRSFYGLRPRFRVHGPDHPGLATSLSAVEIVLGSVRMRDGSVHRAPASSATAVWAESLQMGEGGRGSGCELSTELGADPGEIESLNGAVVVRMPSSVKRLILPRVEPGVRARAAALDITLVRVGRDEFSIATSGRADHLVAVRAYNARGESLALGRAKVERSPSRWVGTFPIAGQPTRIDVFVAEQVERVDFGFSLRPRLGSQTALR